MRISDTDCTMALFTGRSWSCKNCSGLYTSLFSLVAHVREAHSDLNSTCGVNNCEQYAKKAYTWYNHVRRHHPAEYNDFTIVESTGEQDLMMQEGSSQLDELSEESLEFGECPEANYDPDHDYRPSSPPSSEVTDS